MAVIRRGRAGWWGACCFVMVYAGAAPAFAQVTQTDSAHTPLPQPVGLAEANLVNSSYGWNSETQIYADASGTFLDTPLIYGAYYAPPSYPQFVTGDAITLSGLFKWRKEAIDPVRDAKIGPGYFSAQCGFTVEVLLKGGSCALTLGWYNVNDPSSTAPPSAAQIYPFVDDPTTSLNCTDEDGIGPQTTGFCPLAWDNVGPFNLSQKRWVPKQFSTGDLSKDPRYTGGFVAFALIGSAAPGSKCTQTKFSMYEHNQRNGMGDPWVTALIYPSKLSPGSVYLAFEDLPMPSSSWTASSADGDFNDFVYYVSGCPSSGGGSGAGAGGGGSSASGANAGGASAGGSTSTAAGRTGEAGEGVAGDGQTDGTIGGAAGAEEAAGSDDVAGNGNALGGSTALGGADSATGAGTHSGGAAPGASDTKSSSCAYAGPRERASQRALPLLGLALGVAFLRRRRRDRRVT